MLNNFSLTFSPNQDFFNGEKNRLRCAKKFVCLEARKFRCHLGNTDLKFKKILGVGGFPEKCLRNI